LNAIHETVKILSDDDALDIFKATLPSGGSLLQVGTIQTRLKDARAAAAVLQKHPAVRPELRFLELALLGKKVDFSKVTKIIDDMIALLAREQKDDEGTKKYCVGQLHNAAGKAQDVAKSIKEQEANKDERAENLAAITDEVKSTQGEIKELDMLVADATSERKAQNVEFTQVMSGDTAAKEILQFAKKRLDQFYNPEETTKALALAAQQSQITQKAVADPFPMSASPLNQIPTEELFKVLDARQPRATTLLSTYITKGEENNKVVAMMNQLIFDVSTEMALAQKDEEHSQGAYESLMGDSAKKRATYVKSSNVQQNAKAESDEMKTEEDSALAGSRKQAEAIGVYQSQLHKKCDWMLQNFDLRRSARADEADNLNKAKAVLHGADFSLVQTHKFLGRHA